jgi:hypothetical protein
MAPYTGWSGYQSQAQANIQDQAQQQIATLRNYYERRENMLRVQLPSSNYQYVIEERNDLRLKVANLEEKIKRLKGGRMARKDFFTGDGYCREHRERNCETCLEEWHDTETTNSSKAIVLATSALINGNEGMSDLETAQIDAQRDLTRKLRFIKKSLNFTDEQIKKKKIKELPTLIKQAEDAMTIGGMIEILGEDIKDAGGVIKSMLRFFFTRRH